MGYVKKPRLNILFNADIEGKTKRKKKAKEAVERYGYTQKEVADFIGIHYSVVSKLLKRIYARSKT
ncbi:MAG: helix-turn-helix domain-containing protein [Thermodesulfovibrionia bacterium]|nr:helix-turn-helix domain-containing protein [Thermodesulfovibrionia bacterium]